MNRQNTHDDHTIRAAIVAMHGDGQVRSIRGIGRGLRAADLQVCDNRLEGLVKRLRIEGLIPGPIHSPAARPGPSVSGPDAGPEGERPRLPWPERWKRAHLSRERRIQRFGAELARAIAANPWGTTGPSAC